MTCALSYQELFGQLMRRVLILPSVCSVFLRVLFWLAPPASAQTGADEQRLAGIQRSIQAGDLRRASSELDDLRKRLAGEPRIYNLLGAIAARENDLAAAEANFRKAIQLAPRFTAAHMNLGRLYQENAALPGALEKALEVYRKVLEFAPSDVEANYQEARLFNQLGKFDLSLRYL